MALIQLRWLRPRFIKGPPTPLLRLANENNSSQAAQTIQPKPPGVLCRIVDTFNDVHLAAKRLQSAANSNCSQVAPSTCRLWWTALQLKGRFSHVLFFCQSKGWNLWSFSSWEFKFVGEIYVDTWEKKDFFVDKIIIFQWNKVEFTPLDSSWKVLSEIFWTQHDTAQRSAANSKNSRKFR